MFVLSFKMSRKKILFTLMAVVVVCALGVGIKHIAMDGSAIRTNVSTEAKSEKIKTVRAENNQQRIEFLHQFGWEVSDEPDEIKSICIPSEFNDVYINYNKIQKHQGFDLEKYKGKSAKVYTYKVENYPDYNGDVLVHIIIYKSKVIGGDVGTANIDGFMHGFSISTAETTE